MYYRRTKSHYVKYCRECGSPMVVDDIDENFKGNYDDYLICENCQTSCILQVRYSKPFKEIWHSENDNKVNDYILKVVKE